MAYPCRYPGTLLFTKYRKLVREVRSRSRRMECWKAVGPDDTCGSVEMFMRECRGLTRLLNMIQETER